MEETLKSRLVRLRTKKKLTQSGLARKAGVSQGTIGNIESGVRGYGSSVVQIAAALDVSPDYLLLNTDDPGAPAKSTARPLTLGESLAMQINNIRDPGLQNAAYINAMHAIEDVLSPGPSLIQPIDMPHLPANQGSMAEPRLDAPRASKKRAKN